MKYYKIILLAFLKLSIAFAAIRGAMYLINTNSWLFYWYGILLFITTIYFIFYQIYLTIKKQSK